MARRALGRRLALLLSLPILSTLVTCAPAKPASVGCEGWVPQAACARLQALANTETPRYTWAPGADHGDVRLAAPGRPHARTIGAWTYVVAAPFYTVADEVSSADLLAAWRGERAGPFAEHSLLVSPDTRRVFGALWGAPAASVDTADEASLLAECARRGAWALLPFDELTPGWKVLRVDGISPLEKGWEAQGARATYFLQVPLALASDSRTDALARLASLAAPLSNRQEGRMTVVAMTGTSALTRGTARLMEQRGVTYPALDIRGWLAGADLAHVSHEVSFTPDCPVPAPLDTMVFCAHDRYIALLEAAGVDVIELTGNHLLDYGPAPFLRTLDLYQQRGWRWYGGGRNLAEAQQPLLIVQGPNRLAFVGCNVPGPVTVWAGESTPGAAHCDAKALRQQIADLRAQGYLPIVTLQYLEREGHEPTPQQIADFRGLASAGAAVVQGSSAHWPQPMELYQGCFIHYGLGNLFFDQMQSTGTRLEFVDHIVFYEGRLLSVALHTATLEEAGRPRPTTPEERRSFLQMIFSLRPGAG
ncbi:MAG: CapA family protein [Anaerolineae bacterium]